MKITVMAHEKDSFMTIVERASREWVKLNPPGSPNWKDELKINFLNFSYEQIMGKTFTYYAHFEISKKGKR